MKDDLERKRLSKVLSEDLGEPVGYVLPLHWSHKINTWSSSAWEFRRGEMFLVPGDSAMGLRLPLNSLPWVAYQDRDHEHERSLFENVEPLGDIDSEVSRRYSTTSKNAAHPAEMEAADDEVAPANPKYTPHTALTVESRAGRLHVFLPPTTALEHYLDIIASIEATASELKLPVIIEGYQPPHDLRLTRLPVTPDPGVIEVNIHPATSWKELVHNTTTLYELARLTRLGTEKFMLDGRHTGTGGGNHITLGGITPADSPMLRRPDLLRSLITYWQHHPALSYLFSGLFIGPTSQAPRVDEARNDNLYELEIAFQQMPGGEVPSPWLVDRLLRNLLVDMTGNTHRSEFCIDKLYAPGLRNRPPRPAGTARLRDAAACPDEPDADAAVALADSVVLENAVQKAAGALGHTIARPLHAAAFHCQRYSRCRARPAGRGLRFQTRMDRSVPGVSLSTHGNIASR